jgi:hypothetical protein
MQDGSLPICILSHQRPPLGPPYNYYRANAWRCYTLDSCWLLISHYVRIYTHAKEIEESGLTRQADTTESLVCFLEVLPDLRVHIRVPR